ncbi:MAG TPA: hypothetical protein VNU01_01850 [Egibacteraceae bacterium]|nr:hypothetical protein [Egibacteraceae bacterium]
MMSALLAGAIAVPILDLGSRRGFLPAFAAGSGAASADQLYAGFLGLTLLNPMTVTYFGALVPRAAG